MSGKPINISVDNKWSKWKCIARNTTTVSIFLEVLKNPGVTVKLSLKRTVLEILNLRQMIKFELIRSEWA